MDREQVPFDEAALVKSIGLDYVQIPMNANEAYSEIFLNKFIDRRLKERKLMNRT